MRERRTRILLVIGTLALFACGCSGVPEPGSFVAHDEAPDGFAFVDQNDVPYATQITSDPVTLSGFNTVAAVTIEGGTYSIDCGTTFTSAKGKIRSGQSVCVRHTSAAEPGTATNTMLIVNGVADTFTSTTPFRFTVSGTITATAGAVTDSDVNDPNASYAPNDDLEGAQHIGNPATVGGYANQPNTGEPGRSQIAGDVDDVYHVTLAAGQVIVLTIADTAAGDLDLYLGDEAGNLVASSEGTGNTELINVPTSGRYFIDVYAFEGASNYTLTIGQFIGETTVTQPSILADFVPGELVARFEGDGQAESEVSAKLSSMAMQKVSGNAAATERPVLIKIDQSAWKVSSKPGSEGTYASEIQPALVAGNVFLVEKWRTLRTIKQLRKQSEVRYAEPNYILRINAIPNDQLYGAQWHYPLIGLPQAWDITTGSNAVTVAVIDTGVLLGHPDLQSKLVAGYDFVSNPSLSGDGDGMDPNPDDPGASYTPGASSFHGTHVAGTIAAASNNSIGVAGVAWNARIMPLRVLGLGGTGSIGDINEAILYAAGLQNSSNTVPAKRADIINMSLGGSWFSQAQQDVVRQARAQGVLIIASSGNEALEGNPINYPASYDGVVSVGAVAMDQTRAAYSTFNAFVDIAAPGGDSGDRNGDGRPDAIASTCGDDRNGSIAFAYCYNAGTSMAAPHVSGVAALMKAVSPGMTPDQFDGLLSSGAMTRDLGTEGRDDQFGYGLVDAYAAVLASQPAPTPVPAELLVTPNGLNFGTEGASATLTLVNAGSGDLTITSVSDDATWLTVGDASDADTGLGTRTITIDRSGLATDTYVAAITIESTANKVTIPIIMQVDPNPAGADAGYHYVLLVDAESLDTLYVTGLIANRGQYQYSIPDVEIGTYFVVGGSDLDNDSYICDPGEACGAYPTLDVAVPLRVEANVAGIDFVTGVNAGIHLQSESRLAGGTDGGFSRR